ncbi:unnamed protein product [Medioppia subpectinata]|uniref:Uncharacterized protein n=1 Tax=Medioppia subpectinata TaxID=1979941 RepID=A0A7R9KXM2_9ACAR|nr:unnamed protein product [Medioppia subpectinata]CAG2111386.1 unnamed protein product [Medioppia subpectinata]
MVATKTRRDFTYRPFSWTLKTRTFVIISVPFCRGLVVAMRL